MTLPPSTMTSLLLTMTSLPQPAMLMLPHLAPSISSQNPGSVSSPVSLTWLTWNSSLANPFQCANLLDHTLSFSYSSAYVTAPKAITDGFAQKRYFHSPFSIFLGSCVYHSLQYMSSKPCKKHVQLFTPQTAHTLTKTHLYSIFSCLY